MQKCNVHAVPQPAAAADLPRKKPPVSSLFRPLHRIDTAKRFFIARLFSHSFYLCPICFFNSSFCAFNSATSRSIASRRLEITASP